MKIIYIIICLIISFPSLFEQADYESKVAKGEIG